MAFDFIAGALQQQQHAGLFRQRQVNDLAINFSANDYLGLATHPRVVAAWQQGADVYGVGSGGSFLVTGYTRAHARLEARLALLTGYQDCLLFNSGYSANQAIIKALVSKQDLLLQDKLNHASLLEAGAYSPATMKRFRHNDSQNLQQLLSKYRPHYSNALVISEGVFSMDGDQAPLAELAAISRAHDAWLFVDDAHGFGVVGDKGTSLSQQHLNSDDVQLYMATFGKALGVSGAFVAGSQALINYLVNFSKPYIYSTAMPAAAAEAITTALDVISEEPWRRAKLQYLIGYFKRRCQALKINTQPSVSPIQPIIIGDTAAAVAVSTRLRQRGILAIAIRPPTVPRGLARLRITLTAAHSEADIDYLLSQLQEALSELH